jgi:opacity protein-like surface antigen
MRQRTRFFLAASCAAALCFVTKANAQIEEEPFSWTGFYLGGNVGGLSSHYGFGPFTDDVDVDAQFAELDFTKLRGPSLNIGNPNSEVLDDFGFASFPFSSGAGGNFSSFSGGSDQSILGGGQIGYNKQFGHFVVGIEGDFQGTSAGKSQLSSGFVETTAEGEDEPPPPPPPPSGLFNDTFGETTLTAERKAESDWSASLRARFGYAVGHLLFYGTAGVAFTDVKVTATETASTDFFEEIFTDELARPVLNGGQPQPIGNFIGNVTSTNFSKSDDDVEIGWTGGVGSEWAVNKTVTLGVEYRHSDYGSRTYHFVSNEGVIFPGDTKVSLDTDQVTFRVNFLISNFFGH